MATAKTGPDVLGVAEIAELAGVSKKTVSSWVDRGTGNLPPHTRLSCGPVWRAAHITEWLAARAHSYLPNACSDCRELGRPCGR